jgi:4-diphosphocytidyl-2-C-methyl-D-erythritol kinase
MSAARVPAQAKVNLVLGVMPKLRPDGFHDVFTMLQLIDLADDIIVRVGGAGRTLHVAGPRLPDAGLGPTEKNLAFRGAMAYSERAGWPNGFSIELTKNVPAGAGLGGGSSDAGAVLRALDALNEHPLGPAVLAELAASLGSDVPFFVSGSARAMALGRGDEIGEMDPLPARDVVLAVPPFGISTADAYRWLDEARVADPDLWPPAKPMTSGMVDQMTRSDSREAINDWKFISVASYNDFEPAIDQRHPELPLIRGKLEASGAAIARLSGSGSVVFGIFDRLPGIPDGMPKGTTIIRTRTSARVVPVEVLE